MTTKIFTVDIRYLEYPLSRPFTMSNFLFGLFSILINFPFKSVRHLEVRYLERSLCRTIFLVPSVIFGLFPIRYLEHSNAVFEWIMLFISDIRILITALTKLWLSVLSFFQYCSGKNISSSYVKTPCEKFRREMPGFERPKKRFSNKGIDKKWCTLLWSQVLLRLQIH